MREPVDQQSWGLRAEYGWRELEAAPQRHNAEKNRPLNIFVKVMEVTTGLNGVKKTAKYFKWPTVLSTMNVFKVLIKPCGRTVDNQVPFWNTKRSNLHLRYCGS